MEHETTSADNKEMGHTHKRGNVKYTDGTSNLPGLFLANVPGKKNTNILAKWLAVFCDFVFLSVSNLPGIPGKLAFFRTGVNKNTIYPCNSFSYFIKWYIPCTLVTRGMFYPFL